MTCRVIQSHDQGSLVTGLVTGHYITISQEIEVSSWSGGSGTDLDWNLWGPENKIDAGQWEQWCDSASTHDPDTCIVAVTAIQWVYISGESTSTCSDLDQRTTYFPRFVLCANHQNHCLQRL
jgi:hypothetical protein